MRYRVHYCVEDERRTAEIEAGSPEEAMVKFRHTRSDPAVRCGRASRILSVSPEPDVEEATW